MQSFYVAQIQCQTVQLLRAPAVFSYNYLLMMLRISLPTLICTIPTDIYRTKFLAFLELAGSVAIFISQLLNDCCNDPAMGVCPLTP